LEGPPVRHGSCQAGDAPPSDSVTHAAPDRRLDRGADAGVRKSDRGADAGVHTPNRGADAGVHTPNRGR